ncbi:hypothetical protein EW145_g2243 [Phellinidium pouzarii]|uniref:DUF6533 domain-containing protein n=1 Tax=Phellinidium pouzarii TaxID=167371 RepID=A0A4S4LDG4_9AGAM|nr:hypothetical protein EW145_g2243 [Phellinidium pouzarii]
MASLNQLELLALFNDLSISNYTLGPSHFKLHNIATYALLTYDYLLTFSEEKRLVWSSRLSIVKIAFTLNRYLPFVTLPTVFLFADPTMQDICFHATRAFSSLNLASYFIAEFILYFRAYAVWGGDRKLSIILLGGYMALLASSGYFATRFIWNIKAAGCTLTFNGQLDWPAYIALLVSETFAMVVLISKALEGSVSVTMKRIVADGVVYYLLTLASTITNILVLRLASPTLCNFLLATQAVLHSIICNHLLLRIRGACTPVVTFTSALSGITFAHNLVQNRSIQALPGDSSLNELRSNDVGLD